MGIDLDQPLHFPSSVVLELAHIHRWSVYHRLQELSIPCWCAIGQPLRVVVNDAPTLLLVWSVLKSCTAPRQICQRWLEHCWQASV